MPSVSIIDLVTKSYAKVRFDEDGVTKQLNLFKQFGLPVATLAILPFVTMAILTRNATKTSSVLTRSNYARIISRVRCTTSIAAVDPRV